MRVRMLMLCSHGSNRSVNMAFVAKLYGWDVLSAGVDANESSTIHMLTSWADYIWIAQEYMKEKIHVADRCKIVGPTIGEDIWGINPHPDLVHKIREEVFPQVAHEVRLRVEQAKQKPPRKSFPMKRHMGSHCELGVLMEGETTIYKIDIFAIAGNKTSSEIDTILRNAGKIEYPSEEKMLDDGWELD